jgi:hypothetical protein
MTTDTQIDHRLEFIEGELVDLRRLGDAAQKILEDYFSDDLEGFEPLLGIIAAIRDKVNAAIKIVEMAGC